MFDLLELHPGIVVLHDFYLSGIIAHIELSSGNEGFWSNALYRSHGYHVVHERHKSKNPLDIMWKFPANLPVLQNATGIIVHSKYSCQLAEKFYAKGCADNWEVIPHMRRLPQLGNRQTIHSELGFKNGDFVLCSFGFTGPTKLNDRLVKAWPVQHAGGHAELLSCIRRRRTSQ